MAIDQSSRETAPRYLYDEVFVDVLIEIGRQGLTIVLTDTHLEIGGARLTHQQCEAEPTSSAGFFLGFLARSMSSRPNETPIRASTPVWPKPRTRSIDFSRGDVSTTYYTQGGQHVAERSG